MDDEVGWPLGPAQAQLVRQLAELIARGGGWRFLRGPVVAADTDDYPDAWEENRAGIGRVVARTMWHAHLELDVAIDDVRRPAFRGRAKLRETQVELVAVDERRAIFQLEAVGNDDVAGLVSHEVGRAFVAQLGHDGHPFRRADDGELPALATGSLAAVYLGLGVVAANSARYERTAGEVIGRTATYEHKVAHAGGLDSRDLAFLLAVQATVRDDVLTAHDTLRPTQAKDVAAWRDVLDDHEDELLAMLGTSADEVDRETAPKRLASPRAASTTGAFDERDLHKQNYGQRVFRAADSRWSSIGVLGTVIGIFAPMVPMAAGVIPPSPWPSLAGAALGSLVGALIGARLRFFRCTSCGGFVAEVDTDCRLCGGRIAGQIKSAMERLEREDELEAAEEEAARARGNSPRDQV